MSEIITQWKQDILYRNIFNSFQVASSTALCSYLLDAV